MFQEFDALVAKDDRCCVDTGAGHSRRRNRNGLIQIKSALGGKAKAVAPHRQRDIHVGVG